VKPGLYTVESWNNKDAVLIREDGEFLSLTKNELPKEFGGELFVGEKVDIVQITTIRPAAGTLDDRCRTARAAEVSKQHMSQKLKDFIAAENERRMRYGVKPL
jgi:hypothetical protein